MKIEDLILNLTHFGANFHLNETVRFGKNNIVSCISLEKKRSKNDVVLKCTICLLLPLDAQRTREEESFVACFSPLSLSLSLSQNPKKPEKTPHLPEP
jgi:hypothetical protein